MKLFLLTFSVVWLTACSGADRQVLPPELQGNPLASNLPSVSTDPLSDFPLPVVTPKTDTETQLETVLEETEIQTEVPTEPIAETNCEVLTQDLETSFADMNFCNTNDDCAVATGSCPFGCYLFHNRKIDFADYQPALTAYQENCDPCVYKCAAAPQVNNRRCVEGRCVDTRYLE